MSTDNVTVTSPEKRPLTSRKVISDRASAASNDLYRASRMLMMLALLTHNNVIEAEESDELNGVAETLDCINEIVSRVANNLDSVVLLAPEQKE